MYSPCDKALRTFKNTREMGKALVFSNALRILSQCKYKAQLLHLLNIKGIFKLKYIILKSCTKNSVKKTGQDSSQNLTFQGATRAANNRTNSIRAFEIDNECLNTKRQISLNLNNQNGALKKNRPGRAPRFPQ